MKTTGTFSKNNIIITCSKKDLEFAQKITEQIIEMHQKLKREFPITKPILTNITLAISESVDDYIVSAEKKKEDYQDWMVGHSILKKKRLCLLSPNIVKDYGIEEMIQIALHEFVHLFFDYYFGEHNTLWIVEGVAIWYADQTNRDDIDIQSAPTIKKLEENFYDGGYIYSGIYVNYLIHLIGSETFTKIYANELNWQEYITENFEKDAIIFYLNQQ